MPVSDQQQRAIVFLAVACRPTGARRWQEAGVAAAVAKVAHMSLPDVAMAVLRAAADRNAETPGVIPSNGPHWSEGSVTPAWEPNLIPPHRRCSVCSHDQHDGKCPRCSPIDDHAFEPATADHKRGPEQIHQIVVAAKGELVPTKPPPEPAEHAPDPRADVAREAMTTKESAT